VKGLYDKFVDFAYSKSYITMINLFKSCMIWLLFYSNHMLKTAWKKSEKYKSYDYFEMAYKHDAEHDVAMERHNCEGFYFNVVFLSKVMF